MTTVLFSSSAAEAAVWAPTLRDAAAEAGIALIIHTDPAAVAPEAVDVLVLNPEDGLRELAPYAGVKLIQSIWAGVEAYLANPTLPKEPPLCRMVVSGLTEGMTDYVVGHVLRHHLDIDRDIRNSASGVWAKRALPLSRTRKVGVLGLGALGRDAATMLARLRFDVAGWSRSPKTVEGVTCFYGDDGLRDILARSEIIVALLPSTPGTRHLLNAETLALTPRGAAIINAGRGTLIDDAALLAALDTGQIGHATLDVFEEEPLPDPHPYWRNPNVTITPHIAAETRHEDAARVVIENIRRVLAGEPLLHVVDHARGY